MVRIAVLGAGRMGSAHANVLASVPDCAVTLVADVRLGAAQTLAATLEAEATSNMQAPFESNRVDAVLVATPVSTHAALVEAAVKAAKPAFVEKPITASLAEGRELVRTVERAGAFVQVGFQRRFDPAYVEAKRAVDAGDLGDPWVFRGIGRDPGPIPIAFLESSGGVFMDMGIHDLDTARWLMGEVAEVYATGGALTDPEHARRKILDSAVATLRFESGALGTIETSWRNAYGYEVKAEVVGSRGRIVVERDRALDATFFDREGAHNRRPNSFADRFREGFVNEMTSFVEHVREGMFAGPTARDAWYSLRLALAVQQALEQGTVVHVTGLGEEP